MYTCVIIIQSKCVIRQSMLCCIGSLSLSLSPTPTPRAQSSSEVLLDGESGFSLFDALRDTIYSEVATLIANNESRPHYLVSHMT